MLTEWYPGRSVRYALKEVTTTKGSADFSQLLVTTVLRCPKPAYPPYAPYIRQLRPLWTFTAD